MTLTAGGVLRAWRQGAGLSVRDLAARLDRQPSAVSMWENDRRSPSVDSGGQRASTTELVRLIGAACGWRRPEQHGLVDMWRCAGLDSAMPPRRVWAHNYDADGGPAWVWLRCSADSASATLGWGPFGRTVHVGGSAGGLLVHAPTSAPNPPLEVTFTHAGWAGFGRGVVPDAVADLLGIRIIDGRDHFGGRFADPPALDREEEEQLKGDLRAMRHAAARLRVAWSRVAPHLGAMRPNTAFQPLDSLRVVESTWDGDVARDPDGAPSSQLLQSPTRVRQVRDQQGLSRDAAAEEVNRLAGTDPLGDISGRQLASVETTGRLVEVRWLIARLDTVYTLDGQLGVDRILVARADIHRDRATWKLTFPGFWRGPVWLHLRAPETNPSASPECGVELLWGHWRRRQIVESGTVVTTRKAEQGELPLVVSATAGWRLAAGMGLVPGALDMNHDWYPINLRHAARLVWEGWRTIHQPG